MCDPVTLLTVASTAVGAFGAVQEGKAAKRSSEYQARVAENNAQLNEFSARDAIIRGREEEKKQRRQASLLQSEQRAAAAANGIDIGFGSTLDNALDTAMLGELDALTVRSNAYREAYDFRVGASNNRADAELTRLEGSNAESAGYLNAGNTILTGATDSFGSYKRYKRTSGTIT